MNKMKTIRVKAMGVKVIKTKLRDIWLIASGGHTEALVGVKVKVSMTKTRAIRVKAATGAKIANWTQATAVSATSPPPRKVLAFVNAA